MTFDTSVKRPLVCNLKPVGLLIARVLASGQALEHMRRAWFQPDELCRHTGRQGVDNRHGIKV